MHGFDNDIIFWGQIVRLCRKRTFTKLCSIDTQ